MKKSILIIIYVFLMCSFSSAQSPLPELEKAKEIKLLESNKEDINKIFEKYDYHNNPEYKQWFFSENANIEISYSSGKCSEESEDWNVSEWKVIKVSITFRSRSEPTIKEIGIDYSKFKKERLYFNKSNSYVYHDKDLGIAFETINNEIQTVYFFPPKKNNSLLCDNKELKTFYSQKSWFVNFKLKHRFRETPNYFADVINLILSQDEVIANCPLDNSTQNKICSDSNTKIAVLVSAKDPENDVLSYHYEVSGGKIIGQGSSVIWDLSEVKAGNYTIKTTADDGCGFCGKPMTKTVTVKECPDCKAK
jgi:hypothetical protein